MACSYAEDICLAQLPPLTKLFVPFSNLSRITAVQDDIVVKLRCVCCCCELRSGYVVQRMERRDVVDGLEDLIGQPTAGEEKGIAGSEEL